MVIGTALGWSDGVSATVWVSDGLNPSSAKMLARIDIGGSTGVVASHLAREFGWTATIIDPAPLEVAAVDAARGEKRVAHEAAERLVLLGDPNQLPQVSQGAQPEQRGDVLILQSLSRRGRGALKHQVGSDAGEQLALVDVAQQKEQLRTFVQARSDAVQHGRDVLAHRRPVRAAAGEADLFRRREQPIALSAYPFHHRLSQPSLQQLDDADVMVIVGSLTEKQAAAILQAFPPERAAIVSRGALRAVQTVQAGQRP